MFFKLGHFEMLDFNAQNSSGSRKQEVGLDLELTGLHSWGMERAKERWIGTKMGQQWGEIKRKKKHGEEQKEKRKGTQTGKGDEGEGFWGVGIEWSGRLWRPYILHFWMRMGSIVMLGRSNHPNIMHSAPAKENNIFGKKYKEFKLH